MQGDSLRVEWTGFLEVDNNPKVKLVKINGMKGTKEICPKDTMFYIGRGRKPKNFQPR